MIESNLLTLMAVLFIAGVLSYRVSYLQRKQIGYLSLQQIVLMVVIPGFLLPLLFSYLQSVTRRPLSPTIFLPDRFLINMTLLAVMFVYGGVAIHAITKVLSDTGLRNEKSLQGEINKFFHLTFSHNLIFAGGILIMMGLVLLELNHVPVQEPVSVTSAILKGFGLGASLIAAMYFYTKSKDDYSGRWADLKGVFLVLWLVVVILLYALKKLDARLTEYQLILPALVSLGGLAFLNAVLVVRRVKRGWQVYISQKRLKKSLQFWEEE